MIVDLTQKECEDILAKNHYAHLGCVDGDEPYVVPITYVFQDGFAYGYMLDGLKVEHLRKNPKTCLQVERVVNENEWESVICWGSFEELGGDDLQKIRMMFAELHGKSMLEGRQPEVSPAIRHLSLRVPEHAVVYCVKPYRVTGKASRLQ